MLNNLLMSVGGLIMAANFEAIIPCDVPISVTNPPTPQEIKDCDPAPPPNNEPNINNPGNQTSTEGNFATLQIIATDPDLDDTLSYSAIGLPPGLAIDGAGLISGTVSNPGSYSVNVEVTDGEAFPSVDFGWQVNPEVIDPPPSGQFAFVEVPVEDAPGDTEPFGVACADFDKDGFIECMISEHEGGTHTRWEWNGSSFAYKDALTIPKCDLDIYAVDANLDGDTDLFCAYVNWPASSYVPFAGGDLDPSKSVTRVCGQNRLDNCAPVLEDGSILARSGNRYTFDGVRATLATNGYIQGTNSYTQVGGWFVSGVAVDLREYLAANETISVKHTMAEDFTGDGIVDILFSPHVQSASDTQPPIMHVGGTFAKSSIAREMAKDRFPGLQLHRGPWNQPRQAKFVDGSAYWHSYGNMEAADLNQDGDVDVMVFGGTYTDMHQLWLGNGDGTFTRSDALEVIPQGPGGGPGGGQDKPAGRIIDFDQDGCLDLFVTYPRAPAGSAYAKALRNVLCDD